MIGWKSLNKWYYGAEYSNSRNKIANPSNLFTIYFTSSNSVKGMIKRHGPPDVIEIRKMFIDAKSTQRWETKVLKRLKLSTGFKPDGIWLNRTDNMLPRMNGNKRSKESIDKQIKTITGKSSGALGKTYSRMTCNICDKSISSSKFNYHIKTCTDKIRSCEWCANQIKPKTYYVRFCGYSCSIS